MDRHGPGTIRNRRTLLAGAMLLALVGAAWAARQYDIRQADKARYDALPAGSGQQAVATPVRGPTLGGDAAALAAFRTVQPRGGLTALPAQGNPLEGSFSPVVDWPLVGIHTVLTPDGNVLTYGTRADGIQTGYFVYDVWNPQIGLGSDAHRLLPNTTAVDIFCNAQLLLPSGTVEMFGGDVTDLRNNWSTNTGNDAYVKFDPVDGSLTRIGTMNLKRWYATATMLPSGEVYVQGGSSGGEAYPEVRVDSGAFRALTTAPTTQLSWFYPRNFVGPDGLVFGYASNKPMYRIDPRGSGTLTSLGNYPYANIGDSSTAVMFRPGKILQLGGGSATNGASLIDINGETPQVSALPSMGYRRQWGNATVLADGRVFASGGSPNNNDPSGGVSYTSELYDPASNTWSKGATAQRMRLYHSGALLLPDATVLTLGGGALGGGNPGPQLNLNAEIYYPPYLFNPDGTPAARPIIDNVGIDFEAGQKIALSSADAASISRITLVKAGSVTHSFDMDQRFLELPFTREGTALQAALPSNPYQTPPGFYLLFAFNAQGVPSEAAMIRIAPLPNLVVNGNFEDNNAPDGGRKLMINLPGWKNTAGAVDVWRGMNGYLAGLDASMIEIDSLRGANQVYQDIATTAGAEYELSFLNSPQPGVPAASNRFSVYWNDVKLATITRAGTRLSTPAWQTVRLRVVGSGAMDRLSFRESDGNNVGALVDDVRLQRVSF